MPRKRKGQPDNFNKAFPSAMRQLMEKKGTTQNELADYLQKTRQAVSYYCDGSSSPDWETIAKIADFFNVSTDYLLGRTADPTRQPCAADDLGLTAAAVEYIRKYANPSTKEMEEIIKPRDCLEGLSMLIENGWFMSLSGEIKRFCDIVNHRIELSKAYSDEESDVPSEGYFRWRHAADEDSLARSITFTIESHHPELKDSFEILTGRHIVEHQKNVIIDNFEEILRKVSNFNEYKGTIAEW